MESTEYGTLTNESLLAVSVCIASRICPSVRWRSEVTGHSTTHTKEGSIPFQTTIILGRARRGPDVAW
jgi:hypothetical protein